MTERPTCAGCWTAKAIPGSLYCFTCDPSYPRDLHTATGPGSARERLASGDKDIVQCPHCRNTFTLNK